RYSVSTRRSENLALQSDRPWVDGAPSTVSGEASKLRHCQAGAALPPMSGMLTLEKFTIGVGDRFAHQARAQLRAFQQIVADGVAAVPVWNKSNREHSFIGSEPQSVYDAALAAVKSLGWEGGWHVDADHIRIET